MPRVVQGQNDRGAVATYPRFDGSEVCAQIDPEIWFPTAEFQTGAIAKRLCRTCVWLKPCLQYAVQVDVVGIWGATNEKERSRMRRADKLKVEKLDIDSLVQMLGGTTQ